MSWVFHLYLSASKEVRRSASFVHPLICYSAHHNLTIVSGPVYIGGWRPNRQMGRGVCVHPSTHVYLSIEWRCRAEKKSNFISSKLGRQRWMDRRTGRRLMAHVKFSYCPCPSRYILARSVIISYPICHLWFVTRVFAGGGCSAQIKVSPEVLFSLAQPTSQSAFVYYQCMKKFCIVCLVWLKEIEIQTPVYYV